MPANHKTSEDPRDRAWREFKPDSWKTRISSQGAEHRPPLRADRAVLQSNHIIAEQMAERRVWVRAASGIKQRRDIQERVARHEQRDPVYMRSLMQEFMSERREKGALHQV